MVRDRTNWILFGREPWTSGVLRSTRAELMQGQIAGLYWFPCAGKAHGGSKYVFVLSEIEGLLGNIRHSQKPPVGFS